MRPRQGSRRSWRTLLTSAAWFALALSTARAQAPAITPGAEEANSGPVIDIIPITTNPPRFSSPPACRPPYPPPQYLPLPARDYLPPKPQQPPLIPTPISPTVPSMPGVPGETRPEGTGAPGGTGSSTDMQGGTSNLGTGDMVTGGDTGSNADASSLSGAGGSAVGGGSFTGAGYVDPAIPVTMYRLRVDAANDDNRPDRAEFFYPKQGFFPVLVAHGLPNGTAAAKNLNYEEVHNYLEIACNPRFSAFVNAPVRWIDVTFLDTSAQEHQSGLSDIWFGFKYAFIYQPTQVLTFQLRTYSPTGDPAQGLGRGNWNLEPGLLYYQALGSRWFFEGEIEDFTPITRRDDFAGSVVTLGGALSYLAYNRSTCRIAPVAELVDWTVLSGKETRVDVPVSAAGDIIINAKFGIRFGFGELVQPGNLNRSDFYVGYGRALTGDVWYKNLFRFEYRLRF
jgi:hypothetical protein